MPLNKHQHFCVSTIWAVSFRGKQKPKDFHGVPYASHDSCREFHGWDERSMSLIAEKWVYPVL